MTRTPDNPATYYTLAQLTRYYEKLAESITEWEFWLRDHKDPGMHDVYMLRAQVDSIAASLRSVQTTVRSTYDRIPVDNLACRQGEEQWLVTRQGTLRGEEMRAAIEAAKAFGRPGSQPEA